MRLNPSQPDFVPYTGKKPVLLSGDTRDISLELMWIWFTEEAMQVGSQFHRIEVGLTQLAVLSELLSLVLSL